LTGPGSVRRLVVQVILLTVVLIGLSRLAGRPVQPDGGATMPDKESMPTTPADQMSDVPPDLTFYRTLGKEGPSAPVDRPVGGTTPSDGVRSPRDPAAAPSGSFVVQALATKDGAAARRLRDRLAARGFPATVTEDPSGGATVFRVRVGRYRLRSEAEAAARALQQRDHLRPWVLQEGE
jgi:cell division protein FtsN